MPSLTEALTSDAKKTTVIEECCTLIDQEVADKGGVSGLAIKAGYGAVKGIKPGFIRKVVTDLLPEFASALEPLYQEALSGEGAVGPHLTRNAGRAADALLGITDQKAERSTNKLVKNTYKKLRGTAKRNVEGAMPRLAQLIERHTG